MKSKRVKKQALHIGNLLQAVCYINSDTSRVVPKESNTHAHTYSHTRTRTHIYTLTRRAAVAMLGH